MQGVRTCVACGAKKHQCELHRLTAIDGHLVFDQTQRQGGRGLYVCSADCARKLAKNSRLCAAKLRTKVEEGELRAALSRVIALVEDER